MKVIRECLIVTVRPNIMEAEWAAEEEKYEEKKKKKTKNQKKKTSAETIRHLVLQTGCLNKVGYPKSATLQTNRTVLYYGGGICLRMQTKM